MVVYYVTQNIVRPCLSPINSLLFGILNKNDSNTGHIMISIALIHCIYWSSQKCTGANASGADKVAGPRKVILQYNAISIITVLNHTYLSDPCQMHSDIKKGNQRGGQLVNEIWWITFVFMWWLVKWSSLQTVSQQYSLVWHQRLPTNSGRKKKKKKSQ